MPQTGSLVDATILSFDLIREATMAEAKAVVGMAVLADYALFDQLGKLSVMGVFGQVNAPALPATHGRIIIAVVIRDLVGRHKVTYQIVRPDGPGLLAQPPQIDIDAKPGGGDAQLLTEVGPVVFPVAGRYGVQVWLDDQLLHTIPLTVVITQQPRASSAASSARTGASVGGRVGGSDFLTEGPGSVNDDGVAGSTALELRAVEAHLVG